MNKVMAYLWFLCKLLSSLVFICRVGVCPSAGSLVKLSSVVKLDKWDLGTGWDACSSDPK